MTSLPAEPKPPPASQSPAATQLWLIGVGLTLVGLVCAALGPAELYCFYFFVQGGRYHYPGFQFGSFMFAFLAIQIVGYYGIAAVCLPLGYGHLKMRRWARNLALAGLGFWLVAGLPLVLVFLAVLVTSKAPSVYEVAAAAGLMAFLYPVLPVGLIRFYRSPAVHAVLSELDPEPGWSGRLPVRLWTLCLLFAFWAVVLHLGILLRGAFPVFGELWMDLRGILCIDAAWLLLVGLIWGVWQRRKWAWWGGLQYFTLATVSTVWTLARWDWLDLLAQLQFAPTEVEALDGIPAAGWHLAAFVGLPLVGTLAAILFARGCFDEGGGPG